MKRALPTEGRTIDDDCFEPRPRVRWLAPSVLARTVMPVLLSGLFAKFGDRREVEAVLEQSVIDVSTDGDPASPQELEEMWIDYLADTGDGFSATATLASVLARKTLDVPALEGGGVHATRAGSLLVLGGDQVYPFASPEDYTDRFTGPFRAMLPYEEPGRKIVALPGNHDWYDGLTAFLQVFCGRDWIGGWKAVQRRSYFALKLPKRWWLWGIDIQLDTYIDHPQIEYFKKAAAEVKPGDGIILCWAVPSWVHLGEAKAQAYATLDFFQRRIVPNHANLRVSLTGDSHHYARYEGPTREQKITAGIGGAFTAPTHHLPDKLLLPPNEGSEPITFTRRCEYPTCPDSKALRSGVLSAIYQNDGFPVLPGLAYGAMALAVTGRSKVTSWVAGSAIGGLLVGGCVVFSQSEKVRECLPGILHGSAHVAASLAAAGVLRRATSGWREPRRAATAFFGAGLVGAAAGSALFAAYLVAADRKDTYRRNTNELYAAMALEDNVGFLRLHIRPDGDLDIYPIKIDEVVRWERDGCWDHPPKAPKFKVRAGPGPKPELIESPITVTREPAAKAEAGQR
jgi:hypothetical protein